MPRFQIKRKRVDPEEIKHEEVQSETSDSVEKPNPEFDRAFDKMSLKSPAVSPNAIRPPNIYAEENRSDPVDVPRRKMTRREYQRYDEPRDYQPQYRNRDQDMYRPEPNIYKRGRSRPVDTVRSRGEAGNLRYRSGYGRNNNSLGHSEKVKAVYTAAFGDAY